MRFGIFTVGDLTVKAEEVGLDVFACRERHGSPFVPSSPTTPRGYIGARTSRLILSTSGSGDGVVVGLLPHRASSSPTRRRPRPRAGAG